MIANLAKLSSSQVAADAGPARPAGAEAAAPSPPVRRAVVDDALARIARQSERADVAAAEVNRRLAEKGSELTIEFDDALERTVFRLVDTQTGEVVRQIPSEQVLAIARALADDQASGVLLRTDV